MNRALAWSALLAGTVAPLPAQTFVVGIAGGPGSSFTQIAAAVAAVPDGATLLVRPGTYLDFTIDAKSLTVLADPGVLVQSDGELKVVRP